MTDAKVTLHPWPQDRRFLVGSDGTISGPRGQIIGSHHKAGYILISGRRADGTRFCTGAHSIVCETFHGPRPPGAHAAHKNNNPSDNRPENLSWKTPTGNAADKIGHGTNGRKLTLEDVEAIRAALAEGESRNSLAAQYGVTPGMISHIKTGHSWRTTQLQEESHG
jgi:hypothetical protein